MQTAFLRTACQLAAAASLLAPLSSHAMSAVGRVVVTLTGDARPCFSVPAGFTTIFGIPFHGITVVREGAASPDADAVQWDMSIDGSVREATITSRRCYRYGGLPPGAVQTPARPLLPFTVYQVSIHAGTGNMVRGYSGMFCMIYDDKGKLVLRTVSRAPEGDEIAIDACRR